MRKHTTLALTALACGALVAPAWASASAAGPSTAVSRDAIGQALRHAATAYQAAGSPRAATTAASQPTVVVSGLNNPRQLSLVPSQRVLLVAEAGRGGKNCMGSGDDQLCVGTTGAVSAVLGPQTASGTKPLRIVRGFLSGAGPDGSFAVGSDGVSTLDLNRIFVQETFAPPDEVPSGLPGWQSGKLLRAKPFSKPTVRADVAAFEAAHDPDHQGVESNPYAVLVRPHRIFIADAAGNDVLAYNRHTGVLSLFAVLRNVQGGKCAGQANDNGTTGCDYVPTSLAMARDGNLLVGGLGGETPGAGRVRKLDINTAKVMKTWYGLTTVTGVAMDRHGNVYASQLLGGPSTQQIPGRLTRIAPDGSRTPVAVPFPAGVQADDAGNVYVAAFSVASSDGLGAPNSSGQVWRLRF